MISPALILTTMTAGAAARSEHTEARAHTTEMAAATTHPWYVKAASQQIVNFCFFGGMMDGAMHGGGGGGGGYTTVGGAAPTSLVSFSSVTDESGETATADSATSTTLYATVGGGDVTVYGDDPNAATAPGDLPAVPTTNASVPLASNGTYATITTSSDNTDDDATSTDDSTDDSSDMTATSASDFLPTPSTTSSVPHGLAGDVERLESYAHALANALIAPRQMTKLLANAYEAVEKHGFIHPTQAVQLLSQADHGLKALRTDPAYEKQRANLLAQPTPINYKKAASHAKAQHTGAVDNFLAQPEGHHAYSMAKSLGEKFIKDFVQ